LDAPKNVRLDEPPSLLLLLLLEWYKANRY
jgi:hypothetical protein